VVLGMPPGPGIVPLLDILSIAFWTQAGFLWWEYFSARIGAQCQASMILGLSDQWIPNSSKLCQMVSPQL